MKTLFPQLLSSAELSFDLDIEGGGGCRWSERSRKGVVSEGRLVQTDVQLAGLACGIY